MRPLGCGNLYWLLVQIITNTKHFCWCVSVEWIGDQFGLGLIANWRKLIRFWWRYARKRYLHFSRQWPWPLSFSWHCCGQGSRAGWLVQRGVDLLVVVMRSVYKDLLLASQEDRLLDYGELRARVCCCQWYCIELDWNGSSVFTYIDFGTLFNMLQALRIL